MELSAAGTDRTQHMKNRIEKKETKQVGGCVPPDLSVFC